MPSSAQRFWVNAGTVYKHLKMGGIMQIEGWLGIQLHMYSFIALHNHLQSKGIVQITKHRPMRSAETELLKCLISCFCVQAEEDRCSSKGLAVRIIMLNKTQMGSDSISSFGFSHEFSEGVLLTHNCALELHTGTLYLINLLEDLKGNPAHSNCFVK